MYTLVLIHGFNGYFWNMLIADADEPLSLIILTKMVRAVLHSFGVFSITRRSKSDVSRLFWCGSVEWGCLLETWLMSLWWVRVPSRDLTDVTLVSEDADSLMVSWLDWCDPGEWWYLKKTWLMWLWWVRMPSRDLTDVILVPEKTDVQDDAF